ncbi:MAG: hypothetical protein M3214_13215 [Actinomycetota bacterium]|nr:hypothetical protein [Actinomycetota bacterium]
MAPHKVLLMFAVLFGGGMALGWALQMALESGAGPGVMQWLSVAGVVALLVVLWRVGASDRRAIAAATPKDYGARTPRAIVLGCVLVVAAAWGTATLLNLLGATLEAMGWLAPAVCVPIVLWLMSRAVRTDADRFSRDDAPPQTWAEGGSTLLDEAILVFGPDDPFEPRRYDVADAHGNIVGSIDRAAGSPGETTFIARDARGTQFTISARKLNGRWSATVSDDGGRPVGSLVQALRPLHGLYVAGFVTAIVVLVALFAAPFVLSGCGERTGTGAARIRRNGGPCPHAGLGNISLRSPLRACLSLRLHRRNRRTAGAGPYRGGGPLCRDGERRRKGARSGVARVGRGAAPPVVRRCRHGG